jgi:hypothetical protein
MLEDKNTRLAWPPPWHLTASVLISVIALALVNLSPSSLQGTLSLPALIFVLLIPGYLVTISLFPGKSDLSMRRRAFLCLFSSVLVAGLFSLLLTVTPRGLQSASLATILSLLAIFLAAIAYGRWSDLPRKRRFLLLKKRGLGSARGLSHIFRAGITVKHAAMAIALLAACFIAALAFAFGPYQFPSGELFTKLEVTWPGESSGPSLENANGQLSTHYKEERPVVNLSRNNSTRLNFTGNNFAKIIVIENNSSVISKDISNVVDLNVIGGDMGGGSSESSSQTATKKPVSRKALQPEKRIGSVALKNASNVSLPSRKENQTGKDNITLKYNNSSKSNLSRAISQSEINQPPVLKALVPDIASPQLPGAAIFWKAEASDREGDKIHYKYLLDGREVRKWSKINSWSWLSQGLPAGDHQICVLAIDGKHASAESFDSIMNASFTLSSPNQPPFLKELKSNKPSPQSRGGMITWTAKALDSDNDKILYKFMKNDKDATNWSSSNSWIWNTSSEKPGDYRISVLAKDGLHASKDSSDSSMDSSFALTSPNSSPKIIELKADRPGPHVKGKIITWNAIAVDPDGDEISYRFLADDREVRGWSSSNSWIWNTSFALLGDHKISVWVRDGKHASGDSFDSSKDAFITIAASNEPPALKLLAPDIASPAVQGATVTWAAKALDPEGDKIFYKFQLNGRDMGRWSESAIWKWSSKDLPAGDYRIRVLARDGKHAAEDSFDSSKDAAFSLISEIDQQIDQLMKKSKKLK